MAGRAGPKAGSDAAQISLLTYQSDPLLCGLPGPSRGGSMTADQSLDKPNSVQTATAVGLPDPTPRPIAAELRDMLCLTMVSGVGPHHFQSLVERLGDASAVLDAPMSRLQEVPG